MAIATGVETCLQCWRRKGWGVGVGGGLTGGGGGVEVEVR